VTSGAWRVLLVAITVGLSASLITDVAPVAATNEQRAVSIATLPCDTQLQATSSGFLLDDELIVTVAHAIYDSRDFAVRDSTGTWHTATIQHLDLERDLALLRVAGLKTRREVPLAEANPDDGVRMVEGAASGSVDGLVVRRVNISTNIVGSDELALRRGYELDLAIDPGDSGAAIVDRQGRLVAIVFARSTRRDERTWTTSASEVEAILDLDDVPEWPCGPGFGAELELKPPEPERLAG
jgi:S1-C subfamily serine protease